ncbi:amidohydrolase [Tardiphaga sp.]|uniref:amidohydrolase family protein n=1 Tax=Tardiphaga sp. TaxID=1926292 RepID=UPI00352AF488
MISASASGHMRGCLGIDTHAHVFERRLKQSPNARYHVNYDATPQAYLKMLQENELGAGVLLQPSFLGCDNSYLLQALRCWPDRLRGVITPPGYTAESLAPFFAEAGVVGVRLNLIGLQTPSPEQLQSVGRAAERAGWHISLQCEAQRLPTLLPELLSTGAPLVVEHFGRPSQRRGVDDPGFRYLLEMGKERRVHVKLSAPYRIGEATAEKAVPLLLDAFGPDRLLWGSDWPHTQHETTGSARHALLLLANWIPDAATRQTLLLDTPRRLFRIPWADATQLRKDSICDDNIHQ